MLKISRLTDYATAVILFMQNEQKLYASEVIAKGVGLEIPTASKVLKLLTRAKILISTRGANGGYELAKKTTTINLYDVIVAIEGQTAITECTKTDSLCAQEQGCDSRTGWQKVNLQIKQILTEMTIKKMADLNGSSATTIKLSIQS